MVGSSDIVIMKRHRWNDRRHQTSNLSESKPLVYPTAKIISSGGYSNAVEKAVDVVFRIGDYGGPSGSSRMGGERKGEM